MQRIPKLSVLLLAAGSLSACKQDANFTSPTIPTAGVRFINAVPDTGGSSGLDLRFVDIVENSSAFRVPFRSNLVATPTPASTLIEYKNAQAGSRHFRIFLDDTTAASTVLMDSTVTLEANKNYTFLLWGNARKGASPAMKLTIIDESTIADPGNNVGLRVINTTTSSLDVREYLASAAPPAAATWTVAGMSVSSFISAAPGAIKYNVQPAGGGTALFADAQALPGTAGSVDFEAIPGTTIAGSAVTAIIFPRSVAGSTAPQTAAFAVPAISFMWDRRPPRTCALC